MTEHTSQPNSQNNANILAVIHLFIIVYSLVYLANEPKKNNISEILFVSRVAIIISSQFIS